MAGTSNRMSDMADNKKFGNKQMIEMQEIRTKLISEGRIPSEVGFYFDCIRIYEDNHKNDVRGNNPITTINKSVVVNFTSEELTYIKTKLFGTNDTLGQNILNKINISTDNSKTLL